MKWLLTIFLLSGCATYGATTAPTSPERLVVTGSSTMAPLVTEMARRFEALYPAIKVEVRSGGSGKGISDLRAGASNIGMISRSLLDSEKELFQFPIARDGVSLIVHSSNPLRRINSKQLTGILTGKITRWKNVGGKDSAVVLVWAGKGQGSAELLLEHLNLSSADLGAHVAIIDNAARIREVAGNANAIAPISLGEAARELAAGASIRQLDFDGMAASNKTIRNGSYALSRPLALVTRRLPQGIERTFVDFALSGHVVDLFAQYGFVSYEE